MTIQRRKHSASFKAKVSLEALSELKTLSELAEEYEIHPNVISKWKKELERKAQEIFSGKIKKKDMSQEKKIEKLYQQIGQQKVELDWFKKKVGFSP